ncbi:sigma 54-interacting transcriptional regulator [Tindallia californiensis]|nr:sigma 54-interacting transcriptional regulator [Tindallia californiensis]
MKHKEGENMLEKYGFMKQFVDMMSEGFIFIDDQGIIQFYNKKAKEIFGLTEDDGIGHPAGQLEKGDIVILGITGVRKDDGGMEREDFEKIGIKNDQIDPKVALLGMGSYDDTSEGICKIQKGNYDHLELKQKFLGHWIEIKIDQVKKVVWIRVDEKSFPLPFKKDIAHMVCLCKKTGKVKFYQTRGYTAKGESVKELLMKTPYRAKRVGSGFDVVGKSIFDIHQDDNQMIKSFVHVAKGGSERYIDQLTEINGYTTLCTINPLNDQTGRVGAVLKVEDVSEVKQIMGERDEALSKLTQAQKQLQQEQGIEGFKNIHGSSDAITHVKKLAYKASQSASTVLMTGESGTGKTILAKEIHDAGIYAAEPFVQVNCGGIPESLIESELFGYEEGAFTGAKKQGKQGMFTLAKAGTVFLDEIGELPLMLQSKLLEVLQSKSFYPVGGNKKIHFSGRVIVATNRNLENEISKGKFREDLFYRINVFPIDIPPLRERKEDIYAIVNHLLPKLRKRVGCEAETISPEAMRKMIAYDWPGNVRELENTLEHSLHFMDGKTLFSKHLMMETKRTSNTRIFDPTKSNAIDFNLKKAVQEAEKTAIQQALKITNNQHKEAWELLGIKKTAFYDKLKKYNL